ncbi:MAG: hypothetical protein OXT65_07395 [Alphaproteobacteria bacterium]|nr:hypothetical protein [Alphaproteobacteria bacterium]
MTLKYALTAAAIAFAGACGPKQATPDDLPFTCFSGKTGKQIAKMDVSSDVKDEGCIIMSREKVVCINKNVETFNNCKVF